jgi:antitoxin component YwqK of YwqJK toxin-antitoxin module
MNNREKNFNNSIICNYLVELNGKFNYDPMLNIYFQNPKINFGEQPKWLHYERIELKFTEDFNKGIYREYYKSGNLRREVPFIALENSEDFFANGIEMVFYEDSDSNGDDTYTLLEENEYKCGERVGIWKTYSIDGGLLKEDYFDDVIDLNNGFYGIKQIEYFPSSNKLASINDKDFGKSFYENGSLKAEWKNKNYFKDGDYIEYHENGKLKMKVAYVDGERDGLMPKYYEDGSLKEEWKYSNGVRIYVKKFYPNGILKSEWLYNNGELTHKNEFAKNGNLKTKK